MILYIYKYYIFFDSVFFYCSFCYFIVIEKKKLVDYVIYYVKYVEVVKGLVDNGRSYLYENKDFILLVEGNYFVKMGRKELYDLWVSWLRWIIVVFDLVFLLRNIVLLYFVVDVELVKDVLNILELLLVIEFIGVVVIFIIDDFFSCELNFDFFDKILGYDFF